MQLKLILMKMENIEKKIKCPECNEVNDFILTDSYHGVSTITNFYSCTGCGERVLDKQLYKIKQKGLI